MRNSNRIAATAIMVVGLGFGPVGCYTSGTPGGTGAGGASQGGGGSSSGGTYPTDSGADADSGATDVPECVDSRGCDGGICDPSSHACVGCLTNADCLDTAHRCANNQCVAIISCVSDRTCTPLNLICDLSKSYCVDCLDSSSCEVGKSCSEGLCI
jgi:hypothetical protein